MCDFLLVIKTNAVKTLAKPDTDPSDRHCSSA